MNTLQINKCLDGIGSFGGAHACNMIPTPKLLPVYYIVNTKPLTIDDRKKSGVIDGEHWIVIRLNKDGKCEYFDSFGLPPHHGEITAYLSKHCSKGVKYGNLMLQNPFSRTCGVWCLDFIIQKEFGRSTAHYLSDFKTDLEANDRLVVKRTQCLLSAPLRLLNLNLKTFLN